MSGIEGSSNHFNPEPFNVGAMSTICSNCQAMLYNGELTSICCREGKVDFNKEIQYPVELKRLLTGDGPSSINFREFIRQFNNANAFASMGAKVVDLPGRGPFCFKISGDIYHRSSAHIDIDTSLNDPNILNTPNLQFAELYFYDTDTSVNIRMNHAANIRCSRQNMVDIANILASISPYAQSYTTLRDRYLTEKNNSFSNNEPIKEVRLIFTRNVHDDKRTYNAPTTSNDVALVFSTDRDGNMQNANLDFCVQPNSSRTVQRINPLSRHIDPMVFPLLFPSGESGWTTLVKQRANGDQATVARSITPLQFYSYRIAVRNNIFNPLHFAGKLYQQYLVFAYARVESNNLNYIRQNQKDLRVETYQGLMDHLHDVGRLNAASIGNLYILPSSFHGGPRFMAKLYQDNMAIVRKFGRPDLFITFTCNPNWKEIKDQLKGFQNASDRADIVVRVFNLKLKQLIDDICKIHLFGNVLAYVYVIEYQKRGLPHAHILITLSSADKLRNGDIDNMVSAEIPCPLRSKNLYDVIMKHNIHNPCGSSHKANAVCLNPETGK